MGIPTATPSASTLADSDSESSDDDGAHAAANDLLADELLLEEISIDGMCGVY